jgi:hypothetical protein
MTSHIRSGRDEILRHIASQPATSSTTRQR